MGPGVTTADLLVINKTDLAPLVDADLGVMDRDAKARRGDLPIAFTSLVAPGGADVGRRLGHRAARGVDVATSVKARTEVEVSVDEPRSIDRHSVAVRGATTHSHRRRTRRTRSHC